MIDPITRVIPVPRWLSLGGFSFRVGELRLCELATLQGWLDGLVESPLVAVRGIPPDLDANARQKALARAYKAADKGCPVLFDPSGTAALANPEGRVMLVRVAVKRWRRKPFTLSHAVKVASQMTDGEFAALHDICFAVDPLSVIGRLLFGEDRWNRGPSVSWGEVIDELARESGNGILAYKPIYKLTLSEIANARRGGKPPLRGRKLRHGEDPNAALAAWRELFSGVDEEPSDG
jgi:hypothetical protein